MNISLPDMSGPPVWWDDAVLAVMVVSMVVLARRAVRRG